MVTNGIVKLKENFTVKKSFTNNISSLLKTKLYTQTTKPDFIITQLLLCFRDNVQELKLATANRLEREGKESQRGQLWWRFCNNISVFLNRLSVLNFESIELMESSSVSR